MVPDSNGEEDAIATSMIDWEKAYGRVHELCTAPRASVASDGTYPRDFDAWAYLQNRMSSGVQPIASNRWPPMSAPSFSSFPELPVLSEKRGESSKARQDVDDRPRRGRERRPSRSPSLEQRREDRKHEGRSSRADDERNRKDRSRRHDEDGKRRHREKDECRAERNEETLQEKERRREKERAKALALVRGDEAHRPSKDIKPARREEDEGIPWYEATTKVARRRAPSNLTRLDEGAVPTWFTDTSGDRDALRYSAASSHNPPRYYRDGREYLGGLIRPH